MDSAAHFPTADDSGHPTPSTGPPEAVRGLLASAGVHANRLRRVLALLTAGGYTRAELVRHCAVPRRTLDELLTAVGSDARTVDTGGRDETWELRPEAAARYRREGDLADTGDDSDETSSPDRPELVRRLREFIASGPTADAELDHVTATAETVLARAVWLTDTYDLRRARVLCLGDHDLTSLAVALVEPTAEVTVLDVDERILRHIDLTATEHELPVRTLHADLRGGVPPSVAGWADLVFTDPPYTPEGVGLFATRATGCLADASGRVVLAYGFSSRAPGLGHKVQQELLRVGMVFTAILPEFNRYYGAEAVGSSSDLYVCQPTPNARKLADERRPGIYTHGARSVESGGAAVSPEFRAAIATRIDADVPDLREPDWSRPVREGAPVAVFDLRADPGSWLLRMLLACNAARAAFVVPNNHPDITNQRAQRDLADVIGAKYTVHPYRSWPDTRTAVVLATGVTTGSVARDVLSRAHGKLGNVAREALIANGAAALTKRAAQRYLHESAPSPADLQLRLVDLPRHRIAALLPVLTGGVGPEK